MEMFKTECRLSSATGFEIFFFFLKKINQNTNAKKKDTSENATNQNKSDFASDWICIFFFYSVVADILPKCISGYLEHSSG